MSDDADDEQSEPEMHLDKMPDGCGCAEVWEYLSEQREVE